MQQIGSSEDLPGGKKVRAVAAHFSYISQHGELEIETDRAERVTEDEQKSLLESWHLDLSRGSIAARAGRRPPPGP